MKPACHQSLRTLATQLLLEHGPAMAEQYSQAQLQLIGTCVLMASEYLTKGPYTLLAEAAAIRALLAEQLPVAQQGGCNQSLVGQMRQASATGSLPETIDQAIESCNALRAILTDWHAWVEEHMGYDSECNRQIWTALTTIHQKNRIESMAVMAQLRHAMASEEN
ncbi:MAG: hypothetical protein ACR2PW_04115 [Gammaproteobacteria bacterium]